MRAPIALGLLVVAAAAISVPQAAPESTGDHEHILISAFGPQLSLAELTAAAETIAIVVPTARDSVHWNNATNSRWESDDLAILAMIYNDQTVQVVHLAKGPAASELEIRNVGGSVGGVTFTLEGLAALRPGEEYLVYLEQVDTPTEGGPEPALSFVGQGQGVFRLVEGRFVNEGGLSVDPSGF